VSGLDREFLSEPREPVILHFLLERRRSRVRTIGGEREESEIFLQDARASMFASWYNFEIYICC